MCRGFLSEDRGALFRNLLRLEATVTLPWHDPLDAVHEENRFRYDAKMLGEEGARLWSRFDQEMDRLHATQSAPDACVAEPAQ